MPYTGAMESISTSLLTSVSLSICSRLDVLGQITCVEAAVVLCPLLCIFPIAACFIRVPGVWTSDGLVVER